MEEVELALALVLRQRREDHRHGAAVEAGGLIDLRHGLEILDDAIERDKAEIFVGVFAALELQHEAHLVVAFKKPLRPAQLDVVVVLAGDHPELHFLHPRGTLRLLFLELGLLVLVFPVVDDLADRRVHLAGDFDEVEAEGDRFGQRLAGTHHAELLAGGEDNTDFRGADSIVDPRHIAETTPVLVSLWLSYGMVLRWVDATHLGRGGPSRHMLPVRKGMRNDEPNAGSWVGDSEP